MSESKRLHNGKVARYEFEFGNSFFAYARVTHTFS